MEIPAIGDEGCTFAQIVAAMKKDPSFSRVYEKFAELKIFLDVNLEPHLEERIDIVTKLTMLLSYWRATKGSQATLTVLVTQLEKVGMVSMAEIIYCEFKDYFTWMDTPEFIKKRCMLCMMIASPFSSQPESLADFLRRFHTDTAREEFLAKEINGKIVRELLSKSQRVHLSVVPVIR